MKSCFFLIGDLKGCRSNMLSTSCQETRHVETSTVYTLMLVFGVLSSRTALIMVLIICCGGVPVLEQPSSSLVMEHDRMVWMLEILLKRGIPAPKLQTLF